MIVHGGKARTFTEQIEVPVHPFNARTWISPYHPLARSAWTPAIDHLALSGSAPQRLEIGIGELEIADHRGPWVVDLTGPQEPVYRKFASAGRVPPGARILISAEGELPPHDRVSVILTSWPLWTKSLESIAGELARQEREWALFIPLLPLVTTDLVAVDRLCDLAIDHGATAITCETIELDAAAKRALIERADRRGSDTWQTVFDSRADSLLSVATARHVAARAREAGLRWWLEDDLRDNWAAAAHLSRIATEMFHLGRSPELAASLDVSARAVAVLPHELSVLAESAPLTIVEGVTDLAEDALREWLESGRSELADEIDREWCVRRDAGLDQGV